jgi:hypothetical protein
VLPFAAPYAKSGMFHFLNQLKKHAMKKIAKRKLKLSKKTVISLEQNQSQGIVAGGTFGCTRGRTCTQTCPSNTAICR